MGRMPAMVDSDSLVNVAVRLTLWGMHCVALSAREVSPVNRGSGMSLNLCPVILVLRLALMVGRVGSNGGRLVRRDNDIDWPVLRCWNARGLRVTSRIRCSGRIR